MSHRPTPWWPWAFPGEADRLIDLVRRWPNWLAMPADSNPFPRFRLFRFGRRI